MSTCCLCSSGRPRPPLSSRRHSHARELAGQLEQALRSRAVIGQAIGIVMAESRCEASEAFAVLGRASNNRNMMLRDLAAEIVARVGGRYPRVPRTSAFRWLRGLCPIPRAWRDR